MSRSYPNPVNPYSSMFGKYRDVLRDIRITSFPYALSEAEEVMVYEMVIANILKRIADDNGLNALNFVDQFAVNVRGYILQLQRESNHV